MHVASCSATAPATSVQYPHAAQPSTMDTATDTMRATTSLPDTTENRMPLGIAVDPLYDSLTTPSADGPAARMTPAPQLIPATGIGTTRPLDPQNILRGPLALHLQLDLLAALAAEVADHPGQPLEELLQGEHPHLHDPLLQVVESALQGSLGLLDLQ